MLRKPLAIFTFRPLCPRSKNILFPLDMGLDGAKNIGMGVVAMVNALFPVFVFSISSLLFLFPFLGVCFSLSIKFLVYFPLYLPGFYFFPSAV
jgi:hypothetical protein